MTRKPPPPDDDVLWQQVTKDVRKIARDKRHDVPSAPPVKDETIKKKITVEKTTEKTAEKIDLHALKALTPSLKTPKAKPSAVKSTNWVEDISKGKMKIERKLDLHGFTLTAAHESLINFVKNARAAQCRIVLVVTGKGKGGEGALRREVPLWVQSAPLAAHIRATAHALPQHGGDGALYLFLKKKS